MTKLERLIELEALECAYLRLVLSRRPSRTQRERARNHVATIRALRLAIEHCGAVAVWDSGDPAAAWREWFAANCGEWNDVNDIEAELRGDAVVAAARSVVAKAAS